jgi:hypothetical protein
MMPAPQPRPGYQIGSAIFDQQEYLELLKARKQVSEDLSKHLCRLIAWFFPDHGDASAAGNDLAAFRHALTAFLTVDVDASIKGIEKNPTNQRPPDYPPVTMEDLATITMQCEKLEQQLEELEGAAEHAPEGLGAIIRSAIMPMSQYQLSGAQQHRDRLQQMFDQQQEQTRPPSSEPAMEPGLRSIGLNEHIR